VGNDPFQTASPSTQDQPAAPDTDAFQTVAPGEPAEEFFLPPDDVPATFGRFQVSKKLGAGAFGVVYRAYDPQLDRDVALKVAKPNALVTKESIKGFLREARAAANLRHPNIVPVFDSGMDGEHCYIASAFIPGKTLSHAVDVAGGKGLEPQRAAQLVRQLAEALAYAHKKRVVHRDVKPANVLLDESGEAMLADFGLAQRDEGQALVSQDGTQLAGTPAYMAPEQAEGKAVAASDQYSLGVVLYVLLTGRLPFDGGVLEQIGQHRTQEPPSPRTLKPALPRDLETICLKTLAKQPADRYADCQALADDLRRWLDDEPIQARRASWAERLVKLARRRPALVAAYALTLMVLALLGVAGGMTWLWQQAVQERENVALAKQEAEKARRESAYYHYLRQVDLAYREWGANNIRRARALIKDCAPEFRHWEWGYVNYLCNHSYVKEHKCSVLAITEDAKLAAVMSTDNALTVIEPMSGQLVFAPQGHIGELSCVAISSDGSGLAIGNKDGTLESWELRTGKKRLSVKIHAKALEMISFSPDGERIAIIGEEDESLRLLETLTGRTVLVLRHPASRSESPWRNITFSPDGRFLAASDCQEQALIWDARPERERLVAIVSADSGRMLFSPDGSHLTYIDHDSMKLLATDTGMAVHDLRFSEIRWPLVSCASFSPDGGSIACGLDNGMIELFGNQHLRLRGHTGRVDQLAFTPDGRYLVSGSSDGTCKVWDTERKQEHLWVSNLFLGSVWFDSDGKSLLGTAMVYPTPIAPYELRNVQTNSRVRTICAADSSLCVACSSDGTRFAAGHRSETDIWDVKSGKIVFRNANLTEPSSLKFSPDGNWIASTGLHVDGKRRFGYCLWDAKTGAVAFGSSFESGGSGYLDRIAFSPDGRRLAFACGPVEVWDIAARQIVLNCQDTDAVAVAVAFSPDGRCLAVGKSNGRVEMLDIQSKVSMLTFESHAGSVCSLAFSPDGSRLVCRSSNAIDTVKIWDAQTGQLVLTLDDGYRAMSSLGFSPDGKHLAILGNGPGRLWEARFEP
jgi:WD40 repeat protein